MKKYIFILLFVVSIIVLSHGSVQAFEWAKFVIEGNINPQADVKIFIVNCWPEGFGVLNPTDVVIVQDEYMVYKTGDYDVNYLGFVRLKTSKVASYKAEFIYWPGAELKYGLVFWVDTTGDHIQWMAKNPPKNWGKPTLTDFQWEWIRERSPEAVRPAPSTFSAYVVKLSGKIASSWGFIKLKGASK